MPSKLIPLCMFSYDSQNLSRHDGNIAMLGTHSTFNKNRDFHHLFHKCDINTCKIHLKVGPVEKDKKSTWMI